MERASTKSARVQIGNDKKAGFTMRRFRRMHWGSTFLALQLLDCKSKANGKDSVAPINSSGRVILRVTGFVHLDIKTDGAVFKLNSDLGARDPATA